MPKIPEIISIFPGPNNSKDVFGRSAYEVKNNWCLYERLFNVKKNGVFLFGLPFFVSEIFTLLYYANEESDDIIGGSTKTAQHSIENNSRNIKAVFFKLGTSYVYHN